MKTVWLSGLNVQQKEEMRSSFSASANLRNKAIDILKSKILSARKEQISKEGYAEANWAFKQADLCGYERAMQEIISLFEK